MLIQNLKQFGIGSAFFMFVLLATGMAKDISTPPIMVAANSAGQAAAELVALSN
jgi:hypothetical protein